MDSRAMWSPAETLKSGGAVTVANSKSARVDRVPVAGGGDMGAGTPVMDRPEEGSLDGESSIGGGGEDE